MTYHYEANDIGPSWELMKQDLPENRTRTLQEQIDALEEKYVAKMRSPYRHLDELRAKLTSWRAMYSRWYEVKHALILGWWHSVPVDTFSIGVIAFLLIVICGWLATR